MTESNKKLGNVTRRDRWLPIGLTIALILAIAWLIRIYTPMDFTGDQYKPIAYVMDVIHSGRWTVQTDFGGSVTSKPPLMTWLTALSATVFSGLNVTSLYLPSGLAMLGTALAASWIGYHWFGRWTGYFAGLLVFFNTLGMQHLAFARTDALFTFLITLSCVFALKAWADRSGSKWWLGFWFMSALATLTKGPLGLLIAALGLAAIFWEGRSAAPTATSGERKNLLLIHLAGLILVAVIGGGWFLLAYLDAGQALVDRQIGSELIGHATKGPRPLPFAFFMASFVPWSFLTAYGIYVAIRRPETDPAARRTERFLSLWIILSLAVFSLSSHQRHDHLLPLVVPMAVLAGREISRLISRLSDRRKLQVFVAMAALALVIEAAYYTQRYRWMPDVVRVQATLAMSEDFHAIEKRDGRRFPFTYFNSPSMLEFALGDRHSDATKEAVTQLIAEGDPVFLALGNPSVIKRFPLPDGQQWYSWFEGPKTGEDWTGSIVSNLPPDAIPTRGAFVVENLIIRFDNAGYLGRSFGKLQFESYGVADIRVENTGPADQVLRLHDAATDEDHQIVVPAGGKTTLRIGKQ